MIKPKCFKCGNELTQLGGILLSPPFGEHNTCVNKHHICNNCYPSVYLGN